LAMMPKERIVMAVPFYTRIWKEQEINGEHSLISEVQLMKGIDEFLKLNGLTPEWDEATGQNYVEFVQDGVINKAWLEDLDSLQERLKVIRGADVSGLACWRLDSEPEEVWPIIDAYMN